MLEWYLVVWCLRWSHPHPEHFPSHRLRPGLPNWDLTGPGRYRLPCLACPTSLGRPTVRESSNAEALAVAASSAATAMALILNFPFNLRRAELAGEREAPARCGTGPTGVFSSERAHDRYLRKQGGNRR